MEFEGNNFDEIINNKDLILIDFYATWCGPCKMMHPILEEIEKEYNEVKIIKVDVDKNAELARKYTIMSIPTLILFNNGIQKQKNIGFTPKSIIEEWIKNER